MYDLTVILPTLNEEESIFSTIMKISKILELARIRGEILVVDDNSTDNTIPILKQLLIDNQYPLRFIVRMSNHGLSQSLVDGFQEAKADIILVTDADGQHQLEKIPELYQTIVNGYDIAIGSRYIEGGGIIGWPWYRKFMSWGATSLSRFFFPTITDSGSGFFVIRKSVALNAPLKPQGFRMAFEILGKGNWETVKEIPYTLNIRQNGKSKLKAGTVISYLKQVWSLFVFSLENKDSHGHKEIRRVLTFMAVGLSGVVVNLSLLYILTEYLDLFYAVSSAIGIEASILTNFALNDGVTFKDIKTKVSFIERLVAYHIVCIIGSGISFATLIILTEVLGIWYMLSGIIGILLAFIWNFSASRGLAWVESTEEI